MQLLSIDFLTNKVKEIEQQLAAERELRPKHEAKVRELQQTFLLLSAAIARIEEKAAD